MRTTGPTGMAAPLFGADVLPLAGADEVEARGTLVRWKRETSPPVT
jgi:hypothetical protein